MTTANPNDENRDAAMPRRAFLGAAGAAGLAAAWSAHANTQDAAQGPQKESKMKPCKYWMHGFGGEDPKATARALRETGFDVVVAGGDAVIAAVREEGMESWLCGGAFGVGADEKALQAEDLRGERHVWFGSGCPNQPEIRERNLKSYAKMAETKDIQGILVDGCRFASPASGLHAFFTCFCDVCRDKAATLGCDFAAMRRDAGALLELVESLGKEAPRAAAWLGTAAGATEFLTQYPGLIEWLRFRRLCVTEHFRAIAAILRGAGLRMGVYIFTPSLAPLVGQSYVDLALFVDVFAPMIYRNYPDRPGIACLNWELTLIPEELGLIGSPQEDAVMRMILAWTGLHDTPAIQKLRAGLEPAAIGHETRMARAQISDKELAPIIYIDDPRMAESADAVRNNGADGLNFFVFKENWKEMVRPGMPAV